MPRLIPGRTQEDEKRLLRLSFRLPGKSFQDECLHTKHEKKTWRHQLNYRSLSCGQETRSSQRPLSVRFTEQVKALPIYTKQDGRRRINQPIRVKHEVDPPPPPEFQNKRPQKNVTRVNTSTQSQKSGEERRKILKI